MLLANMSTCDQNWFALSEPWSKLVYDRTRPLFSILQKMQSEQKTGLRIKSSLGEADEILSNISIILQRSVGGFSLFFSWCIALSTENSWASVVLGNWMATAPFPASKFEFDFRQSRFLYLVYGASGKKALVWWMHVMITNTHRQN